LLSSAIECLFYFIFYFFYFSNFEIAEAAGDVVTTEKDSSPNRSLLIQVEARAGFFFEFFFRVSGLFDPDPGHNFKSNIHQHFFINSNKKYIKLET
jgi:hypothetical protein